jgi:hypothetical protein
MAVMKVKTRIKAGAGCGMNTNGQIDDNPI